MNLTEAKNKLAAYGQEHLLAYYDSLTADQQEELLTQIEETDFTVLKMIGRPVTQHGKGVITPIHALQLSEIKAKEDEYTESGLAAIRAGKVGAVLLAGGMGTRLGSDNPKGMYDIGITKPMYIFERLICNLMDVVRVSGEFIHLFIMTSEKNHA
ncbi:MAG: UTP--glucose-1-phosphate uridylyltransferase, partial [Lachnospiraceae bacterium]|nr:UTP--glucose-1-phosphate uridylyltransferase [Lachnospiraceae bacterium]